MNREVARGRAEALNRARVAEQYLTMAELAAEDDADASRNVAVGNAVLAGIAASDSLCCLRLGRSSRSQDHRAAVNLLGRIDTKLSQDLAKLLQHKDNAHYGDRFVDKRQLAAALRAARRLVEEARDATRA